MEDNYFAGVGAIVIKDDKVLLVRHTYGPAEGKLLNPGGYIMQGELPTDAIKREVLEETGANININGMLCIRCSHKDWYMVFLSEYVSGEIRPDGVENSEVLFLSYDEILQRADTTDMVKTLVRLTLERKPIQGVDLGNDRIMYASNESL